MFLVMPYSKSTFGKGLWSTYLPWNNYTSFCSWIQRFRNIFYHFASSLIIFYHLSSSPPPALSSFHHPIATLQKINHK
jgi:hypothetical protein